MYRIYYTDPVTTVAACDDAPTLTEALMVCEHQRKKGMLMVAMVARQGDSINRPGVGGVTHGKLPNGEDYTWTKEDRVGAAFKNR